MVQAAAGCHLLDSCVPLLPMKKAPTLSSTAITRAMTAWGRMLTILSMPIDTVPGATLPPVRHRYSTQEGPYRPARGGSDLVELDQVAAAVLEDRLGAVRRGRRFVAEDDPRPCKRA